MTIDVCTRVRGTAGAGAVGEGGAGAAPAATPRCSDQDRDGAMHCVDAECVVGYRADRMGAHVPAEAVAGVVNAAPGRRFGIAGVDPTSGSVLDDAEHAVSIGMVGVTISPADQGCRPTDARCMRLYEWCDERGVVVMVSNPRLRDPRGEMEFARHGMLDEVARSFPRLRLVLGDLGVVTLEETLLMLARHERVFAETSAAVVQTQRLRRVLLRADEMGATDKLLFGSGYPSARPEIAIERIYSTSAAHLSASGLGGVPREKLRAIVERDSATLLDLGTVGRRDEPVVRRVLPSTSSVTPSEA